MLPWIALAGILFIAVVLRFYNLPQQGIMVGDDGGFIMAARYILWLLQHPDDAYRLADTFHTTPAGLIMAQSHRRPGFIMLVVSSLALFGPTSSAGALVSAVFGFFTVVVVYGITKMLVPRPSALLATALIATSALHIFYSRVGLSNATAAFFWALGLYLWVRFHKNRPRLPGVLFASGLSFGYAITCHYSLVLYVGVVLLVQSGLTVRERAYREILILVIGCLTPFYGFKALGGYEIGGEVARLAGVTFFQSEPFYYIRLLWRYETVTLIALFVVGIVVTFRKLRWRSFGPEESLGVILVVSLILLSAGAAKGTGAPRQMAPLLPLFAVLSGRAVTLLLDPALLRRWGTLLWATALVVILVSGTYANRGFFSWHSGYREAAAYLYAQYPNGRYACSGGWPVCDFYRLGPQVSDLPRLESLSPAPEFLFAHSIDRSWDRGVFGSTWGKRVAEFENMVERDSLIAEEGDPGSVLIRPFTPTLGVIRIYDLRVK